MNKTMARGNARTLSCALFLAGTSYTSMVQAQSVSLTTPPVHETIDDNGVDLFRGTIDVRTPIMSIGAKGGSALSFQRSIIDGYFRDSTTAFIDVGSTVTVGLAFASEKFTPSAGLYVPQENRGSTLTVTGGTYVYTTANGVKYSFWKDPPANPRYSIYSGQVSGGIVLHRVDYPNGNFENFIYRDIEVPVGSTALVIRRLQSIVNSNNYLLKFTYETDTSTYQSYIPSMLKLVKVTGFNRMTEFCDTAANTCTASTARPYASLPSPYQYIDAAGRTTQYGSSANGLTIRYPGSTVDDVTITTTSGKISAVVAGGVTTNYAYVDTGNERAVTLTRGGNASIYKFEISSGLLTYFIDALTRSTRYEYTSGALTRVTLPDGNITEYVRDTRGNATTITFKARLDIGGQDLVASATFPCTNTAACNQPETTTDVRGQVTNLSYDSYGNVTSIKRPAASVGANRPETRFSYAAVNGVQLLTGLSACASGVAPACVGTATESRTTIGYDSNGQPTSATAAAGDGSVSATITTAYDPIGNTTAVDGPLSGTGDTTNYTYDVTRAVTSVVQPDPDGAGPLKRSATTYHYAATGLVDQVSSGAVTNPGDPLNVSSSVAITYDASRRRASEKTLAASGTVYTVAQYSYDSLGRLRCGALRMDPAQWTTQTDACVPQTTGPNGADRVTLTQYDALDRASDVTTAYQTTDAATEHLTFTKNGRIATATDGNNNVTSYSYDGFDRPWRTCFQTAAPTTCATSPSDYEQSNYALNGDISSVRLRDTRQVTFSYDGLGQRTSTIFANPVNLTDSNITYTFDLLGRLTLAQDANGHLTGYGYDALSRATSETNLLGTLTSQYDTAGRRTRLTWGDGLYVTYGYNPAGAMTEIRENGSALLASYTYDDFGRRTARTLGNGTSTTYTYDPVSRLDTLALNGGNRATSTTFGYSPASQIISRVGTNDLFAWQGHYNLDRAYTANGLNQYTASGSIVPSYDGRGNLTSAGATTYLYNSKNQLAAANGNYLYYDPAGRLDQVSQASLAWEWDGDRLVTERTSSGIARRYVHGAGVDEPLVWYEGAGTTTRRWLDADERGSIVRVTDDGGTAMAINTYDEAGIPGAGNLGRFQYTGQMWISELGLDYYKARVYSPTLGRFLQTDPIGYANGLNWYNYVGSDPINKSDPSGLADIVVTAQRSGCGLPAPGEILVCGSQPSRTNFASYEQYRIYFPSTNVAPPPAQPGYTAGAMTPQKNCPAPPKVGPGKATLDKNIRDARNDRPSTRAGRQNGGMLNLLRLSLRVTGDQNYKKDPRYGDAAANFGNFNFGATMQARGFSLEDALGYSNSFQLMTTDRYDPPEDVADVKNGYNYAAQGCNQ